VVLLYFILFVQGTNSLYYILTKWI